MKTPTRPDLDRRVSSIVASFEAAGAAWDEAARRQCRFTEAPTVSRRTWRWCPFRSQPKRSPTALREAAQEIKETYGKYAERLGTAFTEGDETAIRGMDSVFEHVQHYVVRELQRCVAQRADVNVARVLAAADVARGFAVQSLQALDGRIAAENRRDQETLSSIQPTCKSFAPHKSHEKSLGITWCDEPLPIAKEMQALRHEKSLDTTLCDEPLPTAEEMEALRSAPILPAPPSRPSTQNPAEIYDLSVKVLPTLEPWRWCESACRARVHAARSPTTLVALATAAPNDQPCENCPALTYEGLWIDSGGPSGADGRERGRALDFLLKCHAVGGGGGGERPVWVCHVCVARNRYDAAAGPMDLPAMGQHFRARHAAKNSVLPRKRTPRPLTVYAAWEVERPRRRTSGSALEEPVAAQKRQK